MCKILVMGLGGAGTNIAIQVQKSLGCEAIAVNTELSALKVCPLKRQILLGPIVCKGESANVPVRGRNAAEESMDELRTAFSNIDTLVVVAGLGGGTGTGAAPVVVDLAQEMGLEVVAAFVLPFEFEKQRRELALGMLLDLHQEGLTLLLHDNEITINELGGRDKSLLDVFAESAKKIAEDIHVTLSLSATSNRVRQLDLV